MLNINTNYFQLLPVKTTAANIVCNFPSQLQAVEIRFNPGLINMRLLNSNNLVLSCLKYSHCSLTHFAFLEINAYNSSFQPFFSSTTVS